MSVCYAMQEALGIFGDEDVVTGQCEIQIRGLRFGELKQPFCVPPAFHVARGFIFLWTFILMPGGPPLPVIFGQSCGMVRCTAEKSPQALLITLRVSPTDRPTSYGA